MNGRPFDGKGSLAFLNYVLSGTWENETGSGVVESTDNSNQIYKYFGTFKRDSGNERIEIITGEGSYHNGKNLLTGKWKSGKMERKGQVEDENDV